MSTLALIALVLLGVLEVPGWSIYKGNHEINWDGPKVYITFAFEVVILVILLLLVF